MHQHYLTYGARKNLFWATWIRDELLFVVVVHSFRQQTASRSPIHTQPTAGSLLTFRGCCRERERRVDNLHSSKKSTQTHFYASAFSFSEESVFKNGPLPLHVFVCTLPFLSPLPQRTPWIDDDAPPPPGAETNNKDSTDERTSEI